MRTYKTEMQFKPPLAPMICIKFYNTEDDVNIKEFTFPLSTNQIRELQQKTFSNLEEESNFLFNYVIDKNGMNELIKQEMRNVKIDDILED